MSEEGEGGLVIAMLVSLFRVVAPVLYDLGLCGRVEYMLARVCCVSTFMSLIIYPELLECSLCGLGMKFD